MSDTRKDETLISARLPYKTASDGRDLLIDQIDLLYDILMSLGFLSETLREGAKAEAELAALLNLMTHGLTQQIEKNECLVRSISNALGQAVGNQTQIWAEEEAIC